MVDLAKLADDLDRVGKSMNTCGCNVIILLLILFVAYLLWPK